MDRASPQLPVPPAHKCLQYVAGMYTWAHTGGLMQKPMVGIRYLYHSLPYLRQGEPGARQLSMTTSKLQGSCFPSRHKGYRCVLPWLFMWVLEIQPGSVSEVLASET